MDEEAKGQLKQLYTLACGDSTASSVGLWRRLKKGKFIHTV